jgi:DNA-binding MarR family transcriptional regulator
VDEPEDAELREAVRALRAVVQATQTFRRHFADNHDLTLSDTMAMSHLAAAGSMNAGELAKRTGLAPSSLTTLLDRLERLGLASRTTPPHNRRTLEVTLTDAGASVLRETETWTFQALRKVGADNLPEFTRCLQVLATELQRVASDYAGTVSADEAPPA